MCLSHTGPVAQKENMLLMTTAFILWKQTKQCVLKAGMTQLKTAHDNKTL